MNSVGTMSNTHKVEGKSFIVRSQADEHSKLYEENRLAKLNELAELKRANPPVLEKELVKNRTAKEISIMKINKPNLLFEQLTTLDLAMRKLAQEQRRRMVDISDKKIFARAAIYDYYSHRIPNGVHMESLYHGNNPVFTMIYDACVALHAWFDRNKHVAFAEEKDKMRSMYSHISTIVQTSSRQTSRHLLKFGEPITSSVLACWAIAHASQMHPFSRHHFSVSRLPP